MTFTIPAWVLWTVGLGLGIPLVTAVIGFSVFGFAFARAFSR